MVMAISCIGNEFSSHQTPMCGFWEAKDFNPLRKLLFRVSSAIILFHVI